MTSKLYCLVVDTPWHLPLAATLPVISLYASNLGEFSPNVILAPTLICALIAALLTVELHLRYRDWTKATIAASLVFYVGFNYGHLRDLIETGFSLGVSSYESLLLYIVTVATLSILFWIARKDITILNRILNIFFITAMLFSLWKIINFHRPRVNMTQTVNYSDSLRNNHQLPDIYYIVLDAYPRADVLMDVFGIDNSPFLSELKERGFYVADCSLSNYPKTVLHFASTLNMQYLDFSIISEESISELGFQKLYPYYTPLITENQLVSILKTDGYKIYQTATTYNFLRFNEVDLYYQPRNHELISFGLLLMSGIPDSILPERVWDNNLPRIDAVFYSLNSLHKILELPGPKFVFSHIPVPHEPHIFAPDGSIVQNTAIYPEDSYEYINGLENQLLFINAQILDVIDAIQTNKTQPAVIILQSDHGQYTLRTTEWIRTTPWEQTVPILNAVYYPDGNYGQLYEAITPVNTFRLILDQYLNTELGLLPDLSYDFGFPVDYAHPTPHSESWAACQGNK